MHGLFELLKYLQMIEIGGGYDWGPGVVGIFKYWSGDFYLGMKKCFLMFTT